MVGDGDDDGGDCTARGGGRRGRRARTRDGGREGREVDEKDRAGDAGVSVEASEEFERESAPEFGVGVDVRGVRDVSRVEETAEQAKQEAIKYRAEVEDACVTRAQYVLVGK